MHTSNGRRRRASVVAAALLLSAAAACSHGRTSTPSTAPAGTAQRTPSAATTSDPAAAQAITRAQALTRALHSYAFQAIQQISGGNHPQQTTLRGRIIRPGAVAYDLTVDAAVQQVIKTGGHTYLRTPGHVWAALPKAAPTVDPVSSLLPLLEHLSNARLSGHTLSGTVTGDILSQAHLAPKGGSANQASAVQLTLDTAGHITSVTFRLTIKAGAQTLTLNEAAGYSQFNAVPPIKAPTVGK